MLKPSRHLSSHLLCPAQVDACACLVPCSNDITIITTVAAP